MKLNTSLAKLMAPAYHPCPAFATHCSGMRWSPSQGHVPRGFAGGAGAVSEIELVLVFAEPGDPHAGETQSGMVSAYDYATNCFRTGKDQFHRNVRRILDLCWPALDFEQQMRRAWLTESVLCSAKSEGAAVPALSSRECSHRYLLAQLGLLPDALVVALGTKAQNRLRAVGFTRFLAAYAVAPPGCNRPQALESWKRIPDELRSRRGISP